MDITQRGIITLMKSAVTEQALPLPEGFDLGAAYRVFKPHHMSTLMYDGAVRCGISRSDPMMQKLFGQYCQVLMISERQMQDVHRVCAAFDAAGIDYMPLKGSVMKARYPKPELRIMGDADILIRVEQSERIAAVMESLGFVPQSGARYEMVWESDRLHLELHKKIVAEDNNDFYGYLGDGWRMASHCDGKRWSMRAEDEFIYLFIHFARHFRDGGIGCRHVLDLWVFLRSFPQLDMDYIRGEMEKLGQHMFYDNMLRLLSVWFEGAPEDEITAMLTEYIFAGGSYGDATSKALSFALAHESVKDGAAPMKGARLRFFLRILFLGVDELKDKYTVLQKAPWLLPVVWVYRPFYKLLFEKKDVDRRLSQVESISDAGVNDRVKFFRAVGLELRK